MPTPRRGRACDACHTIKLKCELGSAGGGEPPCQRCIRLGKTCLVSPPMRQKDRIAELEAKLEEVTKLLRLHEIQEPSPDVSSQGSPMRQVSLDAVRAEPRAPGRSSKKRRLKSTSTVDGYGDLQNGSPGQSNSTLAIDHVVSRALQKQILHKYRTEVEQAFPFPVRKDYETLREEHPLLLQSVIFVASPSMVSAAVHDELTSIVMKLLAPEEIAKAEKSIELVQAILIASYWFKPPRNQVHIAIDRLVNVAIATATETGIATSESALSAASEQIGDHICSSDAWRTWILCYLHSSSLGTCIRIRPKIPWDRSFEMKVAALEYGNDALDTDRLLCQLARAENLCQQITVEAGYNDSDETLQINNYAKFRQIKDLIKNWKAQVFSSLSNPRLKLYEHIATMFLYEHILHTPTNQRSFAGPYIAERLSLTDFPTPIVTAEHVAALFGLRDACHAALNTFMTFDDMIIARAPFIVFAAKAFYAQWLLVKLYVAVTASGNTYGAFMDAQSLELHTYLKRLADRGNAVFAMEETFVTGNIVKAVKGLSQWVWNYDALRAEEFSTSFFPAASDNVELGNDAFGNPNGIDWLAFDSNFDASEYGLEDIFGTLPT
ncbi:hypothetical protein N431DRAFT_552242 [Stipitochalara longipes BDJ]|nr:hypothetical protein N431DRAFT_552242 [Stipitochalara longipes BDJ]